MAFPELRTASLVGIVPKMGTSIHRAVFAENLLSESPMRSWLEQSFLVVHVDKMVERFWNLAVGSGGEDSGHRHASSYVVNRLGDAYESEYSPISVVREYGISFTGSPEHSF